MALQVAQRVARVRVFTLCLESFGGVFAVSQSSRPDPGFGTLAGGADLCVVLQRTYSLRFPTRAQECCGRCRLPFSEPLHAHLSFAQISKLLFVTLASSSMASPGLAVISVDTCLRGLVAEGEKLSDPDLLQRVLAALEALLVALLTLVAVPVLVAMVFADVMMVFVMPAA